MLTRNVYFLEWKPAIQQSHVIQCGIHGSYEGLGLGLLDFP